MSEIYIQKGEAEELVLRAVDAPQLHVLVGSTLRTFPNAYRVCNERAVGETVWLPTHAFRRPLLVEPRLGLSVRIHDRTQRI